MKHFIFIFCLLFSCSVFSQQNDSLPKVQIRNIDSLQNQKNDRFYKNIQQRSRNSKFTKLLYGLMFEPVNPSDDKKAVQKIENQLQRNFATSQGKIIRNIYVKSLDPFGYTEKDTTVKPHRKIDKIGNSMHARTKSFTVKGLLLFEKNEALDSLKILESERIMRDQKYIRRVLTRPKLTRKNSDSVDVYIYVLDSWSLSVDGNISSKKGELRLREYNSFGLGHRTTLAYKTGFSDTDDGLENGTGYTVGYRAQNLFNTYINAELERDVETDQSYKNYASIDREFYSPYARWAGEISIQKNLYRENIFHEEFDTIFKTPLKFNDFNVWGGYAIPIANKNSKEKLPTNLVFAARYTKRKYLDKPGEKLDSVSYFSNHNIILGSVGIRKINYTRDRYIFRNGDIEDIPIGNSYLINAGVQRNQSTHDNMYLGIDLTFSEYFKHFGYLATNIQYGSNFYDGGANQSLFKWQNTYFSPIFSIGTWYFRQFVRSDIVAGIKRKEFIKDRININEENGIYGFDSHEVFGTRKLVLNFQTQSYVPFSWLGFRMSPFVNFDLGFIGEEPNPFFKNDLYTKVGFGFLISNDYFVFDNVKISFAFFPNIPGRGQNIMKFNVNTDNPFDLEPYRYEPPHILEYQ